MLINARNWYKSAVSSVLWDFRHKHKRKQTSNSTMLMNKLKLDHNKTFKYFTIWYLQFRKSLSWNWYLLRHGYDPQAILHFESRIIRIFFCPKILIISRYSWWEMLNSVTNDCHPEQGFQWIDVHFREASSVELGKKNCINLRNSGEQDLEIQLICILIKGFRWILIWQYGSIKRN